MSIRTLVLRRTPQYERLQRMARRYPSAHLDATALEVYFNLLGVADQLATGAVANLARHDLAEGRFMVLALLLESHPKPLSHSELAELSGVTKGNITGLVDALERDALVKREADAHDRRVTLIALTPAGKRLVEKVLPEHFNRIADVMAPLSPAERRSLLSLLAKVLSAVPVLSRT